MSRQVFSHVTKSSLFSCHSRPGSEVTVCGGGVIHNTDRKPIESISTKNQTTIVRT